MTTRLLLLFLPLALTACAGAPKGPAPVEDRAAPVKSKAATPEAGAARIKPYSEPAIPKPLTVESLPAANNGAAPPASPAPAPTAPAEAPPAAAPAEPPLPRESNPAVVALVEMSETKARAGQYESAAAALESAMRRDPNDPRLPHRMAGIKLQMKQHGQAETWASKSNALAAGDKDLQRRNWRIIETARRALGDAKGAAKAAARASELGG
jgi:hypothetical protein